MPTRNPGNRQLAPIPRRVSVKRVPASENVFRNLQLTNSRTRTRPESGENSDGGLFGRRRIGIILVELDGIEPTTSSLRTRRSPN